MGFDSISMDLLGQDTPVRRFEGIVIGADGPWLVGVPVSHVTMKNHVIVVGVQRYPVGRGPVEIGSIKGWRRGCGRAPGVHIRGSQ